MSLDDSHFQFITDADGHTTAVIVPIEIWNAIQGERGDTEYLNQSPAMRQRLEEAMKRKEGFSLEAVRNELKI